MPVSPEQDEGPKKVKAFRSGLLMAVSKVPQSTELPDLKVHCDNPEPVLAVQAGQSGNSLTGTGTRTVSVLITGIAPPS